MTSPPLITTPTQASVPYCNPGDKLQFIEGISVITKTGTYTIEAGTIVEFVRYFFWGNGITLDVRLIQDDITFSIESEYVEKVYKDT